MTFSLISGDVRLHSLQFNTLTHSYRLSISKHDYLKWRRRRPPGASAPATAKVGPNTSTQYGRRSGDGTSPEDSGADFIRKRTRPPERGPVEVRGPLRGRRRLCRPEAGRKHLLTPRKTGGCTFFCRVRTHQESLTTNLRTRCSPKTAQQCSDQYDRKMFILKYCNYTNDWLENFHTWEHLNVHPKALDPRKPDNHRSFPGAKAPHPGQPYSYSFLCRCNRSACAGDVDHRNEHHWEDIVTLALYTPTTGAPRTCGTERESESLWVANQLIDYEKKTKRNENYVQR